ncbi:MAG: TadG family pilus assembly protein [Sphingomonas sp.]
MTPLLKDRRGALSLLAAGFMPLAIGFAAFAVDIGSAALDARRLQGVADAAALAAAADPTHAQALAQSAVTASGWARRISVTAVAGNYTADATTAASSRFTLGSGSGDAVRVTLQSDSPTYFARIFGQQSIAIGKTATAARERMAAFSIGSRLAAVNGGIVNAYLSALTGSSVSLTAMDYNGLAGVDIDLFAYLSALRTTAHLDAVTFQDVLDAQVTRGQALSAMASSLDAASPLQAAVLRKLALQAGSGNLSLAALIDPGKLGGSAGGATGIVKVNALAAATALLQLASGSRQVSLDLGASVPGLATTRLTVAIGERPAQSPWITVTDNGTPVIRTAQARIYIETQVANVALPGIGSLAAVKVPVFVELASAEGRLSGIDCSTETSRGVTIEARPSPGKAALAAVDTSRLNDFTNAVPLSTARLVDTALIDVDGNATIDLGAAEAWQALRFSQAQITAGTPQTVSSASPVQGVVASLVSHIALTAHVVGLPIPLAPLTQAVGGQLGLLAPAIDGLLDTATGALGVHFGQADVRVTGMRCGTAALVA